MVENTAFFETRTIGLANKNGRNLRRESVATLNFLKINVINRALDRMTLDILNQAKRGISFFILQLDKCCTPANFAVQITKINRRNSDRAGLA